VRELATGHDIVLVSFHGGAEGRAMTRVPRETEIFYGEERGDVYAFAHAVIDAGADVVLGHGPHVPRAVEVYRGRFIAYSLGNFWTYGRFNLSDLASVAPVVDLELARDGRLIEARIHSIRQEGGGVPRIDDSGAAARAVAELTSLDFPESTLRFGLDGVITGFSGAAEGEEKPEDGERPPALLMY
jgi:poly-gamma-glutamate capsule biosynthesis protein CapA/YwtB (metallophosphatase superfamily)